MLAEADGELAPTALAVELAVTVGEELVTPLLECVVGVLARVGEVLHAASNAPAARPVAATVRLLRERWWVMAFPSLNTSGTVVSLTRDEWSIGCGPRSGAG